ncbi:ParM/StbA family protein [Peribacillus asahii]|uniref:ParM/StbA family protein n=1 Tax=Peribacillus asahii TaxID=228899 RepID=UPI00207AAB87|nr:ParM/StbA family protein [Peribacillus asahii]USK62317.1 ParM/StbA family protein [Peribacillus asahii]
MKGLEFLFDPKKLIASSDSGNISNKITYINKDGNIDSINIPSIIGIDAETTPSNLGEDASKNASFAEEMKLHVNIKSNALPKNRTNAFYTVGEYAQITTEENLEETSVDAKDKLGNEIHVVTTLTGLALAAWKTNKADEIQVPLSIGLPIEEAKKTTDEKLQVYIGKHIVTAIDGPYKGQTITIEITDVQVNVEGVTSYLGLAYDLVNGEFKDTEFGSKIGAEFAIADLGAGTFDIGLYDEAGLNPHKSTNYPIGTNLYIERIMNDIVQMPAFERRVARAKRAGIEPKITFTREEFMRKFIKPVIARVIEEPKYTPVYNVTWGPQTEDATEIVVKHMKDYADEIISKVDLFMAKTNVPQMVLVGGGLLFGYAFLKELQEEDCVFPPNLQEASYFTSKSFLLRSIIELAKQEQSKTKTKTKVK